LSWAERYRCSSTYSDLLCCEYDIMNRLMGILADDHKPHIPYYHYHVLRATTHQMCSHEDHRVDLYKNHIDNEYQITMRASFPTFVVVGIILRLLPVVSNECRRIVLCHYRAKI